MGPRSDNRIYWLYFEPPLQPKTVLRCKVVEPEEERAIMGAAVNN